MDKRWIGIIIILIIGVTCMYFIVESSHTVGEAIVDVNKSLVTMPDGFSKGDSDSSSVYLVNRGTNKSINIQDMGKVDIALTKYKQRIDSISNEYDVDDFNNQSTISSDYKIYSMTYKNITENNQYRSVAYIYTYNHTYCVKMTGFNDVGEINKDLDFLGETIRPDYKKSQD